MTGLIPTVYEAADPLRLAITAAYVKAMRSSLRKHRELLDKIQAVKDGKIEPPLYYVQRNRVEEWKQGFIKQLVRQSNLTVQIATDMAVAGAWARDEIQATIAEVYAYRRETFAEELGRMGIRVDFGHYNRRELAAIVSSKQTPFSKIAYRRLGQSAQTVARLNHELANWILLGKPQDDLRKRIQKVACYENIWQANRTAQTERTRIQSQAANDNLLDAERLGLRVAKQWSCKLHNSRDSHIALHGRVVMAGEDFIPGVLAFPGDPRAPAKEVCNCHCVLIERPLLDDEEVVGGKIVKRDIAELQRVLTEKALPSKINDDHLLGRGNNVQGIAKIDRQIFQTVTPDITTDDVVLTDERMRHITERHPESVQYLPLYAERMLASPQLILKDNGERPHTAIVIQDFHDDDLCLRLTLRLHTPEDAIGKMNSIISFQKIRRKEFERLARKTEKIVYKGELP